jgi:hypothetical protein
MPRRENEYEKAQEAMQVKERRIRQERKPE